MAACWITGLVMTLGVIRRGWRDRNVSIWHSGIAGLVSVILVGGSILMIAWQVDHLIRIEEMTYNGGLVSFAGNAFGVIFILVGPVMAKLTEHFHKGTRQ